MSCSLVWRQIWTLVTLVTLVTYGAKGCFLRNCPLGGKRTIPTGVRPCQSCGPNNNGQCVGPNICCGDFGCYIGTRETAICEKENESVQPCERRGQSCGTRGQGVCAANGICCDDDACSLNSKCRFNNDAGEGLINLLSQLLQNEDLEKK
ncbi:hypothetical protein ACJMK2_005544 [Sinanodonta woodiana]|uniref:Uncharacterized protein n=1 Tax=Sinanodonta woodiana TaxID=1069815 RepID=A0ABD3VQF9_SINWO